MGPVPGPFDTLSDYIAFIQRVSDSWLEDGGVAADVRSMNSSASRSPNSMNYTHTIATAAGSTTVTESQNLGVVEADPKTFSVAAAGGTGTSALTIFPTGTVATAESTDASWLTATITGTTLTWTAAANAGPGARTAQLNVRTGPDSFAQTLTFNQAAP